MTDDDRLFLKTLMWSTIIITLLVGLMFADKYLQDQRKVNPRELDLQKAQFEMQNNFIRQTGQLPPGLEESLRNGSYVNPYERKRK